MSQTFPPVPPPDDTEMMKQHAASLATAIGMNMTPAQVADAALMFGGPDALSGFGKLTPDELIAALSQSPEVWEPLAKYDRVFVQGYVTELLEQIQQRIRLQKVK